MTSTSTSTNAPKQSLTSKTFLPDHYYISDQDDPLDYYDNVDEISIPSKPIKKPLINKTKHSSSSSIKTSSSTLSQSTAPALVYVRPNDSIQQNRIQFKLPEYSDHRYDQSTLKSFFMSSSQSSPVTESLKMTTTEKPTTTTTVKVQTTTNTRDFEVQRQKILSFIISENQPSSFRAPSTTTEKTLVLATNANKNYYYAFANTRESTTSPQPNTTSTNSPRSVNVYQSPTKTTILLSRDQLAQNKTIRLTLSSNLDSASSAKSAPLRQLTQGFVEEIPLIKSRQPSLYLKPIEPTTYSPHKPFRTSTEGTAKVDTTTQAQALSPALFEGDPSEMDPFSVHSRRRPYVNDFLTSSTNIPTRFPPRSTTTSTTTETPVQVSEVTTLAPTSTTVFRSVIQSFTSRGLVFKENLNRTFESHNFKPIVSPYISLETQRLTNAIRTTTPRPNYDYSSTASSTTTITPATYRSYFLITAPIKNKTSIPSTFLFPESSSTRISSSVATTTELPLTMKPSPFSIKTESNLISSTENSRGRYRPYVTFTSPNAIDEEPTTYAPRLRFNTRTQTMVETVASSSPPTDQPAARRKIVRLKSALSLPNKSVDPSTEPNRVEVVTTSTPLREVSHKFVASPSRETSQFKPIASKSNVDFVSKLSYSSDSPSTAERLTASKNSFNQLPNKEESAEVAKKPFFYIRFKNASSVEPLETSTKRFRATVEMPEMNVPTEKELNAYVDTENEEVYDDEQPSHLSSFDTIENVDYINNNNRGVHEVDYAYVDSSSTTTTVASSTYDKIKFNTTYSTVSETSTSTYRPPTTSTLTPTSLRTTEKPEQTSTTTANPKSLTPPRTSRVNNAIKTSIGAGLPRRSSASIKCNDISANAKCNEIPSRYYNRFSETYQTNQTNKLFIALDNKSQASELS